MRDRGADQTRWCYPEDVKLTCGAQSDRARRQIAASDGAGGEDGSQLLLSIETGAVVHMLRSRSSWS